MSWSDRELGARVEDAEEVAQLRALRAQALERDPEASFVPVSDEGAFYRLQVRDEFPDDVARAIQRLLD